MHNGRSFFPPVNMPPRCTVILPRGLLSSRFCAQSTLRNKAAAVGALRTVIRQDTHSGSGANDGDGDGLRATDWRAPCLSLTFLPRGGEEANILILSSSQTDIARG